MAYLAALALSSLVRSLSGSVAPIAPPGVESLDLAAVEIAPEGPRRSGSRAQLAWRRWGEPGRPTILLLHGSPGDGTDLRHLGALLGETFHVLAPDLPGFGYSTREVPDYSILAHAVYVEDLLARLGLDRVHVVGFSMGGGVALHLAERAPERIASVVHLSAIGLQEFELLGQYHLNHALHGLQWTLIWLLQNAVPHFGYFDDFFLSLPYARNFFDTDQRPLEAILDGLAPPMLILHGERDVLIPVAAAREHHRRVPQSELVIYEANHFMPFLSPDRLVEPIVDFVARVERGAAATRATATPQRRDAAATPPATLPAMGGMALMISVVLLAFATLASEDLSCIAAGLLVAQGRLPFLWATLACFGGIYLGDLGLYFVGRWGRRWVERAPLRFLISSSDIERGRRLFERRGAWMIFVSRFLPGTRTPTYIAAGVLRMRPGWFAVQLFIPVAIWTPLLVGLAWFFGERFLRSFDVFSRYALSFPLLLVAVWLIIAMGRRLSSHEGRRSLYGWYRRWRVWEFWPLWLLYPPVILRILWFGWRYRGSAFYSPTLFTAANPGIPQGGFVGESKGDILDRLDSVVVARYRRLPARIGIAERFATVRALQEETGQDYPIVLKPDRGERGAGVTIARQESEVETFLRSMSGDALVQEWIGGEELGVFYVRMPREERGRIFAVTDKRLPEVAGDGERTLRRLILDDERAVALAPVYLEALGERAEEVPARGEKVRLVEIGTHCRGAIFLDGSEYVTPELEAVVDEISRGFEGFYFGRYDLRAPSREDFRQGHGVRVLELNGVSSEATHIYDPRYSVFDAWRILSEQWRLAFEVAAQNRERGAKPLSVAGFFAMIWRYSTGRI